MHYSDWLEPVTEISRAAGVAILEVYGTEFAVETKGDNSPLTAADRAAHELIVASLEKLTPDIPVLSEESETEGDGSRDFNWATRRHWDTFWLVDPLDGTKEFVNRNGEFTVNIALIREHSPVLGVVHVPVTSTTYSGDLTRGAWIETQAGCKAIHTRSCPDIPVVVGSRSHAGDHLQSFLDKLGDYHMTPMGSSLKLCLVAAGEADVYPRLGPTSEWDTAAAHAVVKAAGGSVLDMRGQEIRYNASDDILNPWFIVSGDSSVDWHRYLPEERDPPAA